MYGIPRSEFMGWDPEDRAYALAWQEYKQGSCNSCGERYSTSTASSNQFGYECEVVRCHACAAQQRHLQKFQSENGDPAGAMVRFTKMPG